MHKQNALKHLLFEHTPVRPSTKYGKTQLARALTAWRVALELSEGNEKRVTRKLLDDVIESVDRGDNVIDAFYDKKDSFEK